LTPTGTVRIETPEQRQKWLEEEDQMEKSKAEVEEKVRKKKEGRRKKRKEERKKKEEEARIRKEEEEGRQRREEEEGKRNEEDERHKRGEERRRQEEGEVAKAKTIVEDEVESEPEMQGIKMMDIPLTPEPEEGEHPTRKGDVKEKSGGSLHINAALSARRRPGPTHFRQPSSPLTLTRPLEDLGSVVYPAGISSLNPELNAGAKEGKFRYVNRRSCAAVLNCSCFADMIANSCYNLSWAARKNQSRFLPWMQLAWNL
jgi:translation initiation factor 4G